MAITAVRNYTITEQTITSGSDQGTTFEVFDLEGFLVYKSHGSTRDLALQGLADAGFVVSGA